MKKMLFIVFVLLFAGAAAADTFEAGTKSLGGSISFSHTRVGYLEDADVGYRIGPRFSYFLLDNVSLDMAFSYGVNWQGESSNNRASFGGTLGARYFYKNFYGGVGISYYFSRDSYQDEFVNLDSKHSSKELNFSAGYLIEIAKNIFLDAGIDYTKGLGNYISKGTVDYGDGSESLDREIPNDTTALTSRVGISIFFK